MPLDSQETILGANGDVYVAPQGSTLPTDEATALDAAFIQTGYISEDGATLTDTKDINEHGAWQATGPIRRNVRTRTTMVAFNMLQWNDETVPFAFGGGAITEPTPGHYKYTPPDPEDIDVRALVLEWTDKGYNYRVVMAEGMVTEDVESQLNREALAGLPITFAAQSDGTNPPWVLYTDDPAFEAAA